MANLYTSIFPSKKFHEYIFDFIIIVFSIWLSISLDKKARERNNRAQEISTLESIKADMISDTIGINSFIGWNDIVQRANIIFSTGDTAGLSIDTIAYYFYILFQYNPYTMTVSAYEEMKQSGTSSLIENKTNLRDIINHYSTYSGQFNSVNSIDKDFILQHIIPYVDNNFDGYSNADADIEKWRRSLNGIMSDYRFQNIVQSSYNLRVRTNIECEQYRENLRIIIWNIDQELKNLK